MLQSRRLSIASLTIVLTIVLAAVYILESWSSEGPSFSYQSGGVGKGAWLSQSLGQGYGRTNKDAAQRQSDPLLFKEVPLAPIPENLEQKAEAEKLAPQIPAIPADEYEESIKEEIPEPPINAAETICPSEKAWFAPIVPSLNMTFDVPDDIVYDPAGPRPDQIVLLTATDGGGHNGGIDNIMEMAMSNRQAYCDFHGYRNHFINVSKYDLDGAAPNWKKVPAIIETFNTFPDAQWIWMLDLDAIIMTPTVNLRTLVLSQNGLQRALDSGSALHVADWRELGLWVPDKMDFTKADFLISQDHNGINAGSFFVRRSHVSRMFMDVWGDPFFLKMTWPAPEQDALIHIFKHHTTFRQHLGIIKQRIANAFCEGGDRMGWYKGDLIVHFAGCWVGDKCNERWSDFWHRRGKVPATSSIDDRLGSIEKKKSLDE